MRKLVLIKHAAPLVIPGTPSEKWKLSDKGRESCPALAEAIRGFTPTVIVSSEEPKASETAELIGKALSVPVETAADLHEHDRSNVPHLRSGEFISMVEFFFRKPAERTLGRESADEAFERFDAAVESVLQKHPDGNLAIVSHGTVIALLAERRAQKSGFALWREMALPSFLVFDLPDWRLEQTIARLA
jgi:broad specificity phosphatase PhoE